MLLRSTLFLLPLLPSILASFTQHDRDCWRRDCVVRTDAGTLCFEPHDNGIEQQECADSFLKNLTQAHLTSSVGRSIVYYDNKAHMLGAATWAIPPAMAGSVYVCMTGRRLDDPKQYRTICREAHNDDDMHAAAAHANECVSDQKPQHVSDGCFSLGTAADDGRKEWYEEPVVAGSVWVLGALITLRTLYMWGGKAVRAVRARLPRRLIVFAVVVERLCRRWRKPTSPLPTQQPTTISQRRSAGFCHSTALQSETFMLTGRATVVIPGLIEQDVVEY